MATNKQTVSPKTNSPASKGVKSAKPARKSSTAVGVIIAIIIVVLVLLFGAFILGSAIFIKSTQDFVSDSFESVEESRESQNKDVQQLAESFLSNMKNGNYAASYNQLDPALQAEKQNAEAFEDSIIVSGHEPLSWTLEKPVSKSGGSSVLTISGTVVYQDGSLGAITIDADQTKAGRGSQIVSFRFD